jgi:ABC-2 type transport system ATP-binding protein
VPGRLALLRAWPAVDAVSLRISAGEVVGLLGANGAGKTTLIRIMLGLLTPTAGLVRLFGSAPSRDTRRLIGYVPQSVGLYDDLTAAENLDFARAAFGAKRTSVPVALQVPVGVPVGRLALGMQRRIAFVQALAHDPRLLVLDEPTSGVDVLARTRLWDIVREAAGDGVGVLVTTHSMEEAEECDRLVVLAAGRRIAEGSVRDIVGTSRVTTVTTPDWAGAFAALDAAGLKTALVGRSLRVLGAGPEQVRRALGGLPVRLGQAPATLEERFVELTLAEGDRSR